MARKHNETRRRREEQESMNRASKTQSERRERKYEHVSGTLQN